MTIIINTSIFDNMQGILYYFIEMLENIRDRYYYNMDLCVILNTEIRRLNKIADTCSKLNCYNPDFELDDPF